MGMQSQYYAIIKSCKIEKIKEHVYNSIFLNKTEKVGQNC